MFLFKALKVECCFGYYLNLITSAGSVGAVDGLGKEPDAYMRQKLGLTSTTTHTTITAFPVKAHQFHIRLRGDDPESAECEGEIKQGLKKHAIASSESLPVEAHLSSESERV